MSSLELQVGRLWAVREFTKLSATLSRCLTDTSHPLVHLGINLGSWKSIRNEIKNFPRTAALLHRAELDALQDIRGLPLTTLRLADLFPKKVGQHMAAS
jgi:hypothetical protein